MSLADDRGETTLLDSHGLLVKDQSYRAVLTSRRIILTSGTDHIPRSIILQEVVRIDLATDPSGDPTIIISVPADGGAMHTIILHFPIRRFPNALQLRNLWASEINELLEQFIHEDTVVSRQVSLSVPAFCSRCGNRLAGGSAFCDRCGARVPGDSVTSPPVRLQSPRQHMAMLPDNAKKNIDPVLRQQIPFPYALPHSRHAPPAATQKKRGQGKRSFFSDSRLKKPALIVGGILVAIVITAAILITGAPSGSQDAETSSSGQHVSFPILGTVRLPDIPELPEISFDNTNTSPVNAGSSAKPILTFAPGEPGAVLATYPSFFNKGDGAGLHALLSENMQEQNSPDTLNSALASSRSHGYMIQKIEVINQDIDGNEAVLDSVITWKSGSSSQASTPKLFLVNENNLWKLDSLEFHP